MSQPVLVAEVKRIILSIKDDTDVVYWSYFVSAAKDQIVASCNLFETQEKCRSHWVRLFSNNVEKLGYQANFGLDDWFIIEREIEANSAAMLSLSATSTSPPTSVSIPPPISTRVPLQSSQQMMISPPAQSTSSPSVRSASTLGTLLSEDEREAALSTYSEMQDEKKWKLKSGRCVEDVMANVVRTQVYDHPVLHCILDMTDRNWKGIFSQDEIQELNEIVNLEIQYPELPSDMVDFMKKLPTTSSLGDIYNHLETQYLDYYSQQHLIWIKTQVQSAIQLFKRHYFPINDQSERDICAKVWSMISSAFDDSSMTVRMEKASLASKETNNKKRKMALIDSMVRKQSPLVPDMSILYGTQEFAFVEAAKTNNDTKELVEGGKKMPPADVISI